MIKNSKQVKQVYSFRNHANLSLNSQFSAYSSTETYNEDAYMNGAKSCFLNEKDLKALKLTQSNNFKNFKENLKHEK